MDVNDFTNPDKIKTGTGVEIGYNTIVSGGAYMASMNAVDEFDVKDWAPVFSPALVKQMTLTIGYTATANKDLPNTIAIGHRVIPVDPNTVQLGWWDQEVFTVREPSYRLDERDMADIAEADVGLEFIDKLKPIKYKAQYREAAIDSQFPLPHPITQPDAPIRDIYKIKHRDGSFSIDEESYQAAVQEYQRKLVIYNAYAVKVEDVLANRKAAYAQAGNVKDTRFSYGFKPSEVLSSAAGTTFNPFVGEAGTNTTIHYKPSELIVPMVKAIKEEHELIKKQRIDHDNLQLRVDDLETDTTISSDQTLKTEKRSLEESEKAAALEIKDSIGLYRLLMSVDLEGDSAREHVGVDAQEVLTILENHGIEDPLNRYGFICRDKDKETGEYTGLFSIRYGQLTMFILAAL